MSWSEALELLVPWHRLCRLAVQGPSPGGVTLPAALRCALHIARRRWQGSTPCCALTARSAMHAESLSAVRPTDHSDQYGSSYKLCAASRLALNGGCGVIARGT